MNYYQDIADIIVNNTKAKKSIHPRNLSEIFYLLIKEKELDNYVNYLCFTDCYGPKSNTTGIYVIPQKMIYIYKEGLKIARKKLADAFKLKDIDLYLFLNEAVVEVLFHELFHVSQIKYLSESPIYDSKYEVFRVSNSYNFFRNYFNMDYLSKYYNGSIDNYFGSNSHRLKKQVTKFDNMYSKFYDTDPSEINAEYLAIKSIIAINDFIPKSSKIKETWLTIITNFVSNLYLDDNNELRCPLKKFLKQRNEILTLDKVRMKDLDFNLPLDERISLGMPIKGKEYDTLDEYFKKHL